jgi:hypothetical protein
VLIVTDDGTAIVNADSINALSIGTAPDGTQVLVAFCPSSQTIVAAGPAERLTDAMRHIIDAWRTNQKVVPLPEILGPRPAVEPARTGLIVPNSIPPEAIAAAERIMGNGGKAKH